MKLTISLGKYNTIFQAECLGLAQAAKAVLNRKVNKTNVKFVTDSQAVIKALNGTYTRSGLVHECREALQKLGATNNITVQWIKGHSGSLGNDAADDFAKRGAQMETVGPEPIIPLPFNEIKSWMKDITRTNHRKHWEMQEGCRQTKLAFPTLNPKLTRKLLKLSRAELRKICGLITGHCPMNKHLYTLGITDSPLCRACLSHEETPLHALTECEELNSIRAQFLGDKRTMKDIMENPNNLLNLWNELAWLE